MARTSVACCLRRRLVVGAVLGTLSPDGGPRRRPVARGMDRCWFEPTHRWGMQAGLGLVGWIARRKTVWERMEREADAELGVGGSTGP